MNNSKQVSKAKLAAVRAGVFAGKCVCAVLIGVAVTTVLNAARNK